jgi:hypothetical protein
LALIVSITAWANVITQEQALSTAKDFMMLDEAWNPVTDANVKLVEHEGVPAYYIIEYNAGGWVIVSAQSSSSPIIGYNTEGQFGAPEPLSELLNFNAKMITARARDLEKVEHSGWKRVKQRKAPVETTPNSTPDVEPLITINLNQSHPFNIYCPSIDAFTSVTGCVAVGMVQAMMVQGYPPRPHGSHSYTSTSNGIISINFDEEPAYDWDAIYASPTTHNYNEIARLLYHAGVSVNMRYGLFGGSGANTELVPDALINHFGYNKKSVYYTSRCPNNEEWLEQILNELVHGRAIIYNGTSEVAGHCWNIDGWKQSTQMVHCNWGWAGVGNGYFSLDNMTDSYQGLSFLYDHGAIFGVASPTDAPYEILLTNKQFAIGSNPGATLAYVETVSANNNATYNYELSGPDGLQSPYQIVDNRLTTNQTITDSNEFKYLRIKSTDTATGESYEKSFSIQVVESSTHKLLGMYSAHANSRFDGYPDQEWDVTITADRDVKNKVWLRPICLFSNLLPESISPVYAIYNEADSTLTMPLGQVLFESAAKRMVSGITKNEVDIETSGDIVLHLSQKNDGFVISFAEDYVFGVGNINSNKWWYQALYNITFTQKENTFTAPYDIALEKTSFGIGTAANSKLCNVEILCDDRTATFNCEYYDKQGATSPYKIVDNYLVTNETITDSDPFKFLRIKVTNTLTQESFEKVFEIDIVENQSATLEGIYSAYAKSAVPGHPYEAWMMNITADESEPNKVWLSPIFLFAHFQASDISPVYAYYDVKKKVLNLPLGQLVVEQQGSYQFIIGATSDGKKIETTGSIELQVTENENEIGIVFDPKYIIGIGNALDNSWWYQGLRHITYTKKSYEAFEVDGIYYNITSETEKTVEVTFKGHSYYEHINEYSGDIVIPSTITVNGTSYSVTSIDEFAFGKCSEIATLTLPANITSIGKYALASCSGISKLCVEAIEPALVDTTTFIEVDRNLELIVPLGCTGAYKSAQYWNEFTNIKDVSSIEGVTYNNDITIVANNGRIVISGTHGDTMVNVYTMSGILLHSTTASNVASTTLSRGMYLIQIANRTFKIVI